MILDILSSQIGEFTVDTSAVSVEVFRPATFFPYKQAFGLSKFRPEDNILIKSIAVCLPYCFTLANLPAYINLQYYDPVDLLYRPVEELGFAGNSFVHSENVEIETDIHFKWPAAMIGAPFMSLHGRIGSPDIIGPYISMLNCPAILHGEVLPVYGFIKIVHTLEMF